MDMPHPGSGSTLAPLTPAQLRTFDHLLAVGAERPVAPPGLVNELAETITSGTTGAVDRWSESSLYVTKSLLGTVLACEGQSVAVASVPRRPGPHPATVTGQVVHRAVQIAATHPGRPVADYVHAALDSVLTADADIAAMWESADLGTQSDLLNAAVSRVSGFLDSWPMLHASWTPRFELPVQAKVGRLTLSARMDLVLGRPRGDGRQTMLLVDLKSGGLREEHRDEAMFYALIATLNTGVPPFRSTVFSLAANTWTDPDVTAQDLRQAAARVVTGVNAYVDVLTDRRPPVYAPSRGCSWCPAKDECTAFATWTPPSPVAATPAGT